MSASEKLRTVDNAVRGPGVTVMGPARQEAMRALRALPQIVAVVNEQENFNENMWTVQDGDDGEPFVSAEGLRYLREHLGRAATALAALDKALTPKEE